MNLKPNFTGYNAEKMSIGDFSEFCYSLQGLGVLKVISISDNEYPKNYFSALVEDEDGRFYILKNCFVGAVSFSKQDSGPYEFLSKPSLVKSAEEIGMDVEVLSPKVLEDNVTEKHLRELDTYELNEVKNWLPETTGGLLFSWYFD